MKDFYNSIFYKGWRPALGWIVVLSSLYGFVINPILVFVYGQDAVYEIKVQELVALASIAIASTGFRSFEKIKIKEIENANKNNNGYGGYTVDLQR